MGFIRELLDSCPLCGGTCKDPLKHGKPGEIDKLGHRNAVLHGYTDEDTGPNTNLGNAAYQPTREEMNDFFSAMQARYTRMMSDRVFDYSHPVDEYGPQGSPGSTVVLASITLQPDYDMPERIEKITYSIPVGTTLASVLLGQRLIILYQGAALAVPVVGYLSTGIIINSDDPRIFTCTGSTGVPYFGLSGWALTRGQFS